MLIAKIYKNTKRYEIPKLKNDIQTQKDTKLLKIWNTKRYRSTTKYEIPKDIKISKDIKKRKTKDIIYQNIQEYQNIWKIIYINTKA